jgi:aldose 1-epimerase
MRYRIGTEKVGERTILRLFDDESGASAAVLPSYGFNLFDLRLPAAGAPRAVLDAFPDFAANPRSAGRNGTPILFPFPNRIAGAKYSFGGKTFALPSNNGANAIHGFAIDAPWDVIEHAATGDGAVVVGRYQISKQSPERLPQWPADAAIEVRYTLSGRRLTLDATVSNPSGVDLPYGFGIHPYFRLPLTGAEGGDLKRTRVILPASEFWVLDQFIPTGERRSVEAEPRLDFRKGQPIEGLKLDDVLTGLIASADGTFVCRLVDEALGAEFRLGFGPPFRELVAYTPPNAPGVIALEPYTQTTDAINLAARGVDGGLRVLKHDQRETLRITMETAGP